MKRLFSSNLRKPLRYIMINIVIYNTSTNLYKIIL